MNDYPFIKCLYPKLIVNKYTGEQLQVPCNDCVACYNNKSAHWTTLCKIHESDFKFCLMLTLTYNDDTVPYIIPIRHIDTEGSIWYTFKTDDPERFPARYLDDDTFINKSDSSDFVCVPKNSNFDDIQYLILKSNHDGKINVLAKKDCQLFLKRLRKHLFKQLKYDYEKISFFAVGEFGPKHFRPHWHLLLYFNEWCTLRELPSALYKSWTLGNINFSLSRGDAASYCASYLNSFTSLPALFKNKAFGPCQLHSTHFALSYYKSDKEKIYASLPREVIERVRKIGDREQSISVWRTFASTFFPKCRGFSKQSYAGLLRLYTSYYYAKEYYGVSKISTLAWLINNDTSQKYFDDIFRRETYVSKEVRFKFFKSDSRYMSFNDIMTDLYISKHFLNFCCDGDISQSGAMLHKIQAFYKEYDYQRLVNFYKSQESSSGVPTGLFYDNYQCESEDEVIPLISESDLYRKFRYQQFQLAESKIKHKKQNDLNLKFLQNG